MKYHNFKEKYKNSQELLQTLLLNLPEDWAYRNDYTLHYLKMSVDYSKNDVGVFQSRIHERGLLFFFAKNNTLNVSQIVSTFGGEIKPDEYNIIHDKFVNECIIPLMNSSTVPITPSL